MLPNGFRNAKFWSFESPSCQKNNLTDIILYSQWADGKFNEIVYNKKKTVTAWKYNTYRFRNHFVPNPTNSKFIRLKNKLKKYFSAPAERRKSQNT